jgi:hypothetical protein
MLMANAMYPLIWDLFKVWQQEPGTPAPSKPIKPFNVGDTMVRGNAMYPLIWDLFKVWQ